jgi:hypothetical protein
MARTKLQDKFCVPRRDPVKGLILAAAMDQGKTQADCAAMAKVSVSTYQRMLDKHSDEWVLRQILDLTRGLHIPIEELRPLIRQ